MKRPTAEVSPVAATDGQRAGSAARLALRVALPEGFHVQSNAPRDPTLIPTVLTIDAPAGVSVEEIVYPPPTDLEQVGQKQPLAVFEREFAIGVVVRVDPKAAPGEIALPAHLRYQTCNAQLCLCADHREHAMDAPRRSNRRDDCANRTRDAFKGIAFGHGTKPPAAAPSSVTATSPQVAVAGQSRGIAALDGFTELDSAVGYQRSSEFLQWIRDTEAGVKRGGLFEGRGPLAILFLVLVGGLALNLTPCVLPMIPINLAIIGAGAQAGSRGRGFLLGSAYGAAMAVVYGVLGLVVILTAGTFGTINASPWFNAGIALLFVVLGLAMFDLLLIDFSRLLDDVPAGDREPRQHRRRLHDGRGRSAPCRRLRGSRCDSSRSVLERSLRDGNARGARAAVRAGPRHGDSLADRRRRHGSPAKAGRLDGPRETGVRRRDPRNRAVLRPPRLHALRGPLGRRRQR